MRGVRLILRRDLEHPIILLPKKLTGFFLQEVTKDNSFALLHVFFQQRKIQKKVSESSVGQLFG
jgi:hypothetical protein